MESRSTRRSPPGWLRYEREARSRRAKRNQPGGDGASACASTEARWMRVMVEHRTREREDAARHQRTHWPLRAREQDRRCSRCIGPCDAQCYGSPAGAARRPHLREMGRRGLWVAADSPGPQCACVQACDPGRPSEATASSGSGASGLPWQVLGHRESGCKAREKRVRPAPANRTLVVMPGTVRTSG